MYKYFVLILLLALCADAEVAKNYMGTDIQKCINCLCHARSGCWNRLNCARYSVTYDYWLTAGSLTVHESDPTKTRESYKKCMRNENCIVATIVEYTNQFGPVDCNCDGQFDCKDRFAIHLFGDSCANPNFTAVYARRFNECAASIGVKEMIAREGNEECVVQAARR